MSNGWFDPPKENWETRHPKAAKALAYYLLVIAIIGVIAATLAMLIPFIFFFDI